MRANHKAGGAYIMTNFIQRPTAKTEVKYTTSLLPKVVISATALNKMFIYTSEVNDEVGWLGTVEKRGNVYRITDTYLFEQQVHGATTEISPEGLAKFGEELLERPDGMDIWNSMQMWGHSHVNMGVFASGQDDTQMEEFSKNGYPFFIRLICNKKGDMKIDLFDYDAGLTYLDVAWTKEEQAETIPFRNAIEELYLQIEELEKAQKEAEGQMVEAIKEPIVDEIKEKVKKMYGGYTGYGVGRQTGARTTNGIWKQGVFYPDTTPSSQQKFFGTKTSSIDAIDGVKATIWTYFSQKDLVQMANTCFSLNDLEDELFQLSLLDQFSDNDIATIWEKIQYFQNLYMYGGNQ